MLTDDNLRELLEDGMMGLDLSPGNNLYKRAHDEIIALRADLKKQQAVVEAARNCKEHQDKGEPYNIALVEKIPYPLWSRVLKALAALDAKPEGEG